MIRTAFFAVSFLFSLFIAFLFLPGLWVLKLLGAKRAERRYVVFCTTIWSRFLFAMAGIRVTVQGHENIPDHDRICIIGNHQSYGDIPLIIGFMGQKIGFIAKKELGRVPVLASWMKALGCILIDRGKARQAMRGIEEGMATIAEGNTMVIFPEGTRARDGVMKSFKPGGILMAVKQDIAVVPVTIDGLYRCYELTGRITPTKVTLKIHPPINTAGLSRDEQKALPRMIEETVRKGITIQEK